MKVVAFNGSPRKGGNTELLLKRVCERLEKHNIETELVQLGGHTIHGCMACFKCFEIRNRQCIMKKDPVNEYIEKMVEADGILLGSPTYFADVSAEMKALIDRAGLVSLANGHLLKCKVGAAVMAVRRAGAIHVFDSINHFFTISQMIIPGSSYWNTGFGQVPGETLQDAEGLQTMDNLAENMAWIMKCIEAGKGVVPDPKTDTSRQTNFIR